MPLVWHQPCRANHADQQVSQIDLPQGPSGAVQEEQFRRIDAIGYPTDAISEDPAAIGGHAERTNVHRAVSQRNEPAVGIYPRQSVRGEQLGGWRRFALDRIIIQVWGDDV